MEDENSLFRSAASDEVLSREEGRIILSRPKFVRYFAVLAGVFFLLIVGFVFLASYTRRTPLIGQLTPEHGLIKVFAPQPGHLSEQFVSEGIHVKAGDLLFRLATDRMTSHGNTMELIAGQFAERLEKIRQERETTIRIARRDAVGFEDRIKSLIAEKNQIHTQISIARERAEAAHVVATAYESLAKQDYVTNEQVQQKRAEFLDQRERIETLERELTGVSRELEGRRSEMLSSDMKARNDVSQLDRLMMSTKQEQAENDSKGGLELRSSIDGIVTAVTAYKGQVIDPSKPLASIVPSDDSLVAELFAPSNAVGFLRPGQRVLIRLPAYPYQKFGHLEGRVKSVAQTSLPSNELPGSAIADPRDTRNPEPLYRVTISLQKQAIQAYGEARPLQAGMTVQASVFQEERKLYEWALEPLFSISGRF